MPYSYSSDSHRGVVLGAERAAFVSVIQRPDGYQGYNATFSIGPALGQEYFHIHFGPGGCAIRIIRYFQMAGKQGENIVNYNGEGAKSASSLLYEAQQYGGQFPNYIRLFTNLKADIALRPKNARQELI